MLGGRLRTTPLLADQRRGGVGRETASRSELIVAG